MLALTRAAVDRSGQRQQRVAADVAPMGRVRMKAIQNSR
jgi:hypothetical protein